MSVKENKALVCDYRWRCAPRRTVEVCLLPAGLEPLVPRPKKIWADGAYGGKELAK